MGDKVKSSGRKSKAGESRISQKLSEMPTASLGRSNRYLAVRFAGALLVADALLVSLIIAYVPYTKIDWDAYMSQVTGFLGGERDYSNLEGDTGPLVYPAGFLYVYSCIQYITGGLILPAQVLFGIIYIINLAIILFIYIKTDVLPWWALSLLCLSKRVHSIFVLRLFNDCITMTLLHAALATLLYQKWLLGLIVFSLAVSIKMNVLLYAPPLLLLLLKAMDISGTIVALGGAAIVQVRSLVLLLEQGYCFQLLIDVYMQIREWFCSLYSDYLSWSVNFKFVPEPIFVSKNFAISLLLIHLGLLAFFAHRRWCKHEGGLLKVLHTAYVATLSSFPLRQLYAYGTTSKTLKEEHIVSTMFVGNFIGIVCARSLHYQFYSWYFFSLPYLLWKTPFPTVLRIALFATVEYCWNVYPSNCYSSAILLFVHLMILWGLWIAPVGYPYLDDNPSSSKKKK
ncbi:hypothetical protein KSS87_007121 [Heliosperma pusillum]|nr:hypothetical protein KSS87_007121 [Heliosperma pusillum]